MSVPEKPCPWHAGAVNPNTGLLGNMYCEVGPDGHAGSHIGERSRHEYFRLMRAWRRGARSENETTTTKGTRKHGAIE